MYASERLGPDHELGHFASGNDVLDRWLTDHAIEQASRHHSSTFVWTEGSSSEVLAYFTLATHTVAKEEMPSRIGRGGPRVIPAMLLAKLALHRDLRGGGLGGELLIDALSRCVSAAEVGPGAKLVVVDAIDAEAITFYEHYDFVPFAGDSFKLYRTMKSIISDLYGD